jgi:hypothetical protein
MSETDADFLGRYWEQLNWGTDDADFYRLFELARRGAGADWAADWTYPKKGEKRPVGDVLVARICRGGPEQRLWQAMYGSPEDEPQPTVTVAHWHKGRQKWVHGPRDEQVRGVYAWMPLPAPPAETSDDDGQPDETQEWADYDSDC